MNWGSKRASPRIQSYLFTSRVLELQEWLRLNPPKSKSMNIQSQNYMIKDLNRYTFVNRASKCHTWTATLGGQDAPSQ